VTRGGQKNLSDESGRRCIATGETGPKSGLIRFVVGPERMIVPDLAEKLPGRGIWVSADRKALETAVRKRLFARAARSEVVVREDLPDLVESLLARRLVELLSLARKAGVAICGLDKVKESLEDGGAKLLLQASDGSGREKSRLHPPEGQESRPDCLNADELGLAFGRDRVIHAALKAGGITDQVAYEAARLTGLRSLGMEPGGRT
jgi:uncharacterized protein